MSNGKSNTIIGIGVALVVVIVAVLLYIFIFSAGAKYTRLVNEADENFASNRLSKARQLYTEASLIKPDDAYTQKRLAKIDSILTVRDMRNRYNQKIVMADSLFVTKNYTGARDYYFEALNIDPDDPYPVEQIKRIEEILQDPEAAKSSKKTGKQEKTEGENVNEGKNFHIIVGVFNDRDNAIKLKNQLEQQGLNPEFIPRLEYNMVAVSYTSFDDIHSAFNYLSKVREQVHQDAWVLYYKDKE